MPFAVGALLVMIAGAWLTRALVAAGIGWVVFEGFTELAEQLQTAAAGGWGQMGADIIAILSLAGFNVALGVLLAAWGMKAGWWGVARLGRVLASSGA